MKRENIIRAWKDEAYRLSLTEEELAQVPENPAGVLELDDPALAGASGGMWVSTAIEKCRMVTLGVTWSNRRCGDLSCS
jgi:mersacidin/lichenicidin family type 2 lantibiotic